MKIVFKNMPLDFHKNAEPAARAALAAHKQGKFWEYHDELFTQKKINSSTIIDSAEDIDLDIKQFKSDMNSQAIANQVQQDIAQAQQAGVTGTPTVFINGRKLKQRNHQALQNMIDIELQKAGLK